jgi:signal transduction histidine kinase
MQKSKIAWLAVMALLIAAISILHYTTPTLNWQYHLIFMQGYFIPILIGAFQFGIRGGLGTAVVISLIYYPHVMFQWGGLIETNLMRFMQIALFNIIGYLTGLKAQQEIDEKERYQKTAINLEKSLKKLEEQSEQLVELEEQVRFADRLAIVGELTASLAHEMRNPLGSIRGTVDILKNELPQEYRKSDFFEILVSETNRLSAVVENYLGFARKKKVSPIQHDVCQIMRDAGILLGSRARKDGIRLELSLPDQAVLIEGDPSETQQVVVNLLLNAVEAVEKAGRIVLKVEPAQIVSGATSKVARDGRFVRLIIEDEGPGIGPEELDKIFQPFYSTKPTGTGLGLAVVKRIVDENQWKIDVDSQVGRGTRFVLFIPANSASESHEAR